MNNNKSNENLKIKVNRVSSDTGNSYPYTKYLKSNYHQISKIAPKNPILYKVKYKPEIIINEYHQTSNNINTNINIKTNNPKNQNLNNSRNISSNFLDQKKNYSFNRSTEDYGYDNSIKGEDYNRDYAYVNSNKSFNKGRQIRGTDFIPNKVNKSQRKLNENNNNNNGSENNIDIFSPFSNGYSIHSRDSEYKKRNLKNGEDIKHINLNKYNKRSPNYIFQSPIDSKSNKNIQVNTDKSNLSNFMNSSHNYTDNENNNIFFNSRNGTNNSNTKQNTKPELINVSSNALNYRKYNKRPSTNTYLYNRTTPNETESSIESLRRNNNKNNFMFSSSNNSNNNFGIKIKDNNSNYFKNKSYYNTNYSIDKNRDSLNLKLENYRIKLFNEFMKHFQSFYKAYIKKNFAYFILKIRRYQKNSNKSFIYSRKNYLINMNNTIDNHNIHRRRQKSTLSFSHNYGGELINIGKTTTMRDYYKLYNQLKRNKNLNKSMNQINKIFNSYSFSNDNNDSNNLINLNNSLLVNSASKDSLRKSKNLSTLSISKNRDNKINLDLDPKSPTFQYATKTITNSDISFDSQQPINKVNELYRNSKELSKKCEQIRRRKRFLQNRQNYKGITCNKSVDFYNIKKSDQYNQFNELRRYIQLIRKESNSKEKKEKNYRNDRNDRYEKNTNKNKVKRLIRINALDSNSNSEDNDNINDNFNINLNRTYYNDKYHGNLDKFRKKEKDKEIDNENINIRNSIEREGRTGMLRKKKGGFFFNNNNLIAPINSENANTNMIPSNTYYDLIRNKLNNKNSQNNYSYDNNFRNKIVQNYDRTKINTIINNANINNNNNDDNDDNDRKRVKVKVNINKKFLMDNLEKNFKQRSNTINGNNVDYDNNNRNIKKRINTSPVNKNIAPYTKRNFIKYKDKEMPTLIKDISTKDNRIHININYYVIEPKNKNQRKYYIFLYKSENISISLTSDDNLKNYESNLYNRLSAIQEEEVSVQNSRFYDENETFGINNNFINNNHNINNINNNANNNNNISKKVNNGKESKKNYIIYHDNEIVYANIIDSILSSVNNAHKRAFFNNLKALCERIKENGIDRKNNNRIYSRKRGVDNSKIYADKYYSENNNNYKRKKYFKRNVNDRINEEKILKFKNKIIKYIFHFFKNKIN